MQRRFLNNRSLLALLATVPFAVSAEVPPSSAPVPAKEATAVAKEEKTPEVAPVPAPEPAPVTGAEVALPGLADPNAGPPPTPPPSPKVADPGLLNAPVVLSETAEGVRQPVPLKGISLVVDRRHKATEEVKLWDEAQKNALLPGVQVTEGLQTPDPGGLRRKLEQKLDKNPTTFADLQEMVQIIEEHYRSHNRPMTHVYIPKQTFISDRVVIMIVEGRVGATKIRTEADAASKAPDQASGNLQKLKNWWSAWYNNPYNAKDVSAEFQTQTSQLKDRIVDTEEINAQVTAMNRSPWARLNRPVEHPFRQVAVTFQQPEADVVGTTDLIFDVTDERPLKFFAGFDNGLTEITGENRFFLGAAWYDAFMLGKNHQLGAQVFSALDPGELLGFSLNYQIPWQDQRFEQFTELFASYASSTAEVVLGGIATDSTGGSLIFGGRHYLELPELFGATDLSQPLLDKRPHQWAKPDREALGLHHEVGLGFDLKVSDNNLEYGGSIVAESPATIAQLVLEYNARQTDPTGETNLMAKLMFSPGDVTDKNTDEAFNPLRKDATAAYVYTLLRLERDQDLPFTGNFAGMMVRAAVTGQYASSNLLASEQLGLGGFSSVRGYPERALRGDLGWIVNLELYSPEFKPSENWLKWGGSDMLKFLVFLDYAHGESVDENPADPLDDAADLFSVGVGVRYELSDALRLRLDYGFRMEDLPAAADNADSGAAHFGLIYVF